MSYCFWERYEKLCLDRNYKPGSTQATLAIGTNRGTISAWKTSGSPPRVELLIKIADVYGVSTDYLLGRTEDPTDYARTGAGAAASSSVRQKPPATAKKSKSGASSIIYSQLDKVDRGKADAYMLGLLSQDKYHT